MKTNPTNEQRERIKAGVQALRDNPLKAKGWMKKNGGRCCLCVLEEKAKEIGFKGEGDEEFCDDGLANFYGFKSEKLELNDSNRSIAIVPVVSGQTMNKWNDGESHFSIPEKSHKEIADMIEEEYLK